MRGKTNCKKLHSSDFKDFEVVEFYEGQPVGPTKKVVSNLRAFVGTVVRNPQWMTLLYTGWHGVPDKDKEDMWDYINQKFILPIESKKWVMQALFRAWKKLQGRCQAKPFHEVQNNEANAEESTARDSRGSISKIKSVLASSRNQAYLFILQRDSKENKEEPSRAEIFTVTRTSRKGKEIDPKSQSTFDEITSRIEAGQDHEEAFVQVLGKDQLDRLRCYGASVTKSSLKRHGEICQVRGEYDEKVSSLERQMEGVCGLLTVMLQQMNPGKSEEDIAALVQAVRNSPSDASSRPKNTSHSSESTHFPPNDKGAHQ
ncbi:hypothetical protein PIB30_100215 [Stylosanthes scabra]|uniref:Transposase n=1 Tax=Stylosanthes scabra TaxID=79078 RepID=A0ABU6Z026_9FABA|nr:hypothetical protein [Stylosanthes scabra]